MRKTTNNGSILFPIIACLAIIWTWNATAAWNPYGVGTNTSGPEALGVISNNWLAQQELYHANSLPSGPLKIDGAEIEAATVPISALETNAVGTVQIVDGSITSNKLDQSTVWDAIGSRVWKGVNIVPGTGLTGGGGLTDDVYFALADGGISNTQLAQGAVSTSKIEAVFHALLVDGGTVDGKTAVWFSVQDRLVLFGGGGTFTFTDNIGAILGWATNSGFFLVEDDGGLVGGTAELGGGIESKNTGVAYGWANNSARICALQAGAVALGYANGPTETNGALTAGSFVAGRNVNADHNHAGVIGYNLRSQEDNSLTVQELFVYEMNNSNSVPHVCWVTNHVEESIDTALADINEGPAENVRWVSKTSVSATQDGTFRSPYSRIYDAVTNCPDGGTVLVMPGNYAEPSLTNSKSVTIKGLSRNNVRIHNAKTNVVWIKINSGTTTLDNVTLSITNTANDYQPTIAGADAAGTAVFVNECDIIWCMHTDTYNQGTFYSNSGIVRIRDSRFVGCQVYAGGVVFDNGSNMAYVDNCDIVNCVATFHGGTGFGGGVYRHCSITGWSTADESVGGFYNGPDVIGCTSNDTGFVTYATY